MEKIQAHDFWPCPRCGSTHIVGEQWGDYLYIHCGDCGWDGKVDDDAIKFQKELVSRRDFGPQSAMQSLIYDR